jgi:hypothetical protein
MIYQPTKGRSRGFLSDRRVESVPVVKSFDPLKSLVPYFNVHLEIFKMQKHYSECVARFGLNGILQWCRVDP